MKKSMLVVLAGMLLALFSLSGKALADTVDFRSFVLTDDFGPEGQGDLFKRLIAAGCQNLYQALQLLAAQPGSGIPADFVAEVGSHPGSEVFTASLSNFAGANENPVGINADGTAIICDFSVQDYDGHDGFTTHTVPYAGVGSVQFTMATSDAHYIYLGSNEEPDGEHEYYAIGMAWADADSASIPTLNEWGMILLSLVLAGAGLVYMKRRRRAAAN